VIVFLKRKVPQLNPSLSKEEQQLANSRMPPQMILLPDTIQTILKCVSSSTNPLSPELQQEIYQMNIQARLLIDKQQTAATSANLLQQQPSSTAAAIKSLVGAGGSGNGAVNASSAGSNSANGGAPNQATFDIIQSMINLNINPAVAAAAAAQNPANLNLNTFANSPSKLLLSQLNPNLNLQSALPS
jgi:hypothetical protein